MFKLPSDLNDLTYEVIQNNPERIIVGFSSKSLSTYSGCSANDMSLGVMVMYPTSTKEKMEEMTGFRLLLDRPSRYETWMDNDNGPYDPFKLGNYYYFYDDPLNHNDNPTNSFYKYRKHPLGYLDYMGACSNDSKAAQLQISQLGLLRAALSTTITPIKNN